MTAQPRFECASLNCTNPTDELHCQACCEADTALVGLLRLTCPEWGGTP